MPVGRTRTDCTDFISIERFAAYAARCLADYRSELAKRPEKEEKAAWRKELLVWNESLGDALGAEEVRDVRRRVPAGSALVVVRLARGGQGSIPAPSRAYGGARRTRAGEARPYPRLFLRPERLFFLLFPLETMT